MSLNLIKKAGQDLADDINEEAQAIAVKLNVEKKLNSISKEECFFTVKDHKSNFRENPKFRLNNPTKSEIGKIRNREYCNVIMC